MLFAPAQSNDHIDPGHLGPGWRLRQAAELHLGERHVADLPGLLVAEVIVRGHIRVEPGAVAIDVDLAEMVPEKGLEPPTRALRMRCSTN